MLLPPAPPRGWDRRGRQHRQRLRAGGDQEGHQRLARWRRSSGTAKINVLDAPATPISSATSGRRSEPSTRSCWSSRPWTASRSRPRAWELAVEAGLPRAILINKLDRTRVVRADAGAARAVLRHAGRALELPLGEEHDFEGVADLLGRKAYRYGSGPNATEGEWPDDISGKADPFREADGGGRRVRRRPDREVPRGGRALEDEVVHGASGGSRRRGSRRSCARRRRGRSASIACCSSSPTSSPPRPTAVRSRW